MFEVRRVLRGKYENMPWPCIIKFYSARNGSPNILIVDLALNHILSRGKLVLVKKGLDGKLVFTSSGEVKPLEGFKASSLFSNGK
jgi:hypothetical protein